MWLDVRLSGSTVEHKLHLVIEIIFVHIVLYVDRDVDRVDVNVVVQIIVKIDLQWTKM